MKRRVAKCAGCGENREIYALKKCGPCYQIVCSDRQREKAKSRPEKPRKAVNKVSKKGLRTISEDTRFYELIWSKRPHRCEECGCWLGDEWKRHNFSHILTKGAFPTLRHDGRNINLLCLDHHNQWEFGKREEMKIFAKNATIIEILKKEVNERR